MTTSATNPSPTVDRDRDRLLSDDLHPGAAFERSASPAVQRLADRARQLAAADAPVLLTGEPGAGKTALARAIHAWSPRRDRPLVVVAPGAAGPRDTLLVRDPDALPASAQRQLLAAADAGTRLVATAAGPVTGALAERLSLFTLDVPPLRDRRADIATLAAAYLAQLHRDTGRGPWRLSGAAADRLAGHAWPGNLRELANLLERATFSAPAGILDIHLEPIATPAPAEPLCTLAEMERRHIRRVLDHTGGKLYGDDGAAAILGLKPSTLQSRMRKLGIERT